MNWNPNNRLVFWPLFLDPLGPPGLLSVANAKKNEPVLSFYFSHWSGGRVAMGSEWKPDQRKLHKLARWPTAQIRNEPLSRPGRLLGAGKVERRAVE